MEENNKELKYLSIKIHPTTKIGGVARPGDVNLALSTKEDLGHVQSFIIDASVGNIPTAKLTTYMSNLEADILQENTTLIVDDVRESTSLYYLEETLYLMCLDYVESHGKNLNLITHIHRLLKNVSSLFPGDNYEKLLCNKLEKKLGKENFSAYFGLESLKNTLKIKLPIESQLENFK